MTSLFSSTQNHHDVSWEQMLPYESWGKQHAISPLHNHHVGYSIVVTAKHNDTRVFIGYDVYHVDAGTTLVVDVHGAERLLVESDSKVMVMQSHRNVHGLTALVVPAVTAYQVFYPFVIGEHPGAYVIYFVRVVIRQGQEHSLVFEHLPSNIMWHPLTSNSGDLYVGTSFELPPGRYMISTVNNVPFGLSVYVINVDGCAYSYNVRAGASLVKLTSLTSQRTVVTFAFSLRLRLRDK